VGLGITADVELGCRTRIVNADEARRVDGKENVASRSSSVADMEFIVVVSTRVVLDADPKVGVGGR